MVMTKTGCFLTLFNRGGSIPGFNVLEFNAFTMSSIDIPLCEHYGLSKGKSLTRFVYEADEAILTHIVQGWDEAKFGSPLISEKSEPNKVELVLPIISSESNGGSNGGSKQRYATLSANIIDICHDWKSVQEIASIINYSPKYIGSRIIPRMISEGLLETYDKKSPTSPGQKYKAIK